MTGPVDTVVALAVVVCVFLGVGAILSSFKW